MHIIITDSSKQSVVYPADQNYAKSKAMEFIADYKTIPRKTITIPILPDAGK